MNDGQHVTVLVTRSTSRCVRLPCRISRSSRFLSSTATGMFDITALERGSPSLYYASLGEVSEWLKEPVSKTGKVLRPSRVRIPPSPLSFNNLQQPQRPPNTEGFPFWAHFWAHRIEMRLGGLARGRLVGATRKGFQFDPRAGLTGTCWKERPSWDLRERRDCVIGTYLGHCA